MSSKVRKDFDDDVVEYQDERWYSSGSSWLKVTPWGLRAVVGWVHQHYPAIPIYITENGVSDRLGNTDDLHRIYVYKHYINQASDAGQPCLKCDRPAAAQGSPGRRRRCSRLLRLVAPGQLRVGAR